MILMLSTINPSKPSGVGSENSPYEISNAEELYWFAALVNGELEGVSQNTIREFLTIEEVKQLMATPCQYDIVRPAFMFSVPLIEILFVHPSLASSAPEWFILPILWKTHGTGVNHRVFSKESL